MNNFLGSITLINGAVTDLDWGGLFSDADAGLVPNSDGSTVNFLRADGTWNTPLSSSSSLANVFAAVSLRV